MEEALLLIKSLPYGHSEYSTARGFRNLKSIGGSEGGVHRETDTDMLSFQFTRMKKCYIKTLYSCQEMMRK